MKRAATSRKKIAIRSQVVELSILGPEDADQFQVSANRWGRKARESQQSAIDTLVSLGIATASGKLTKRYA